MPAASLVPLAGVFARMGYPVIICSAATGLGLARLTAELSGRVTAVVGQSGVGKSSLLNALDPGLALPVGEVSRDNEKGRHTTTTARLLPHRFGGLVRRHAGGPAVSALGGRAGRSAGRVPRSAAAGQPLPLSRLHPHPRSLTVRVKDAVADGLLDTRRWESCCQLAAGDVRGDRRMRDGPARTGTDPERAILVGVLLEPPVDPDTPARRTGGLAATAGADASWPSSCSGGTIPTRPPISARARCTELEGLVARHDADVVIFDNDLSPAQTRNLERALGVKVLDRSEVILDIFAARARTHEARLAVELAQLEYSLPRLKRMWTHLSRLKMGVGMRGPGEKQLEVDRRLVEKRIHDLKTELAIDPRPPRAAGGRPPRPA